MPNLFDQAEVPELNSCLFLDQDILWLDVSVEEAVAVDVVQSSGYLLDYVSDFLMTEWVVIEFAHLHHSVKVHVEQLEQHVQMVFVAQHLDASYDVGMLQADHCLDLCIAHGLLPRSKFALEGFESVGVLGLLVLHLVHHSETAFAKGFEHFESVDQNRPCR